MALVYPLKWRALIADCFGYRNFAPHSVDAITTELIVLNRYFEKHWCLAFVCFLLLSMSKLVAANPALSEITDLILVTGQSNVTASQTGYDASLDGIDFRVFAYTSKDDWEVADLHQAWDVDGWHPGNGSIQDPTRTPYNQFAFHFAKTLVKNDPARVVGLIIAGAPGRGISHWDANSEFSQIIESKVLAALNAQGVKSEIDGILWHQGETDWQFNGTSDPNASSAERSYANYYPEKLNALIGRFRSKNWFSADKPFICGETRHAPVNARLMALNEDKDPWTGCVIAHDLNTLEMNLDANPPVLGTHFDAPALRTLGRRYAEKYLGIVGALEVRDAEDTVIPVAAVSSPLHNMTIAAGVTDITGSASDSGSGVDRVRVRIHRVGVLPTEFWNGSSWTTTASYLDAQINDNGTWILPDVVVNVPGRYRVRLIAHDAAGNIARVTDTPLSDFIVKSSDSIKPSAMVVTPSNNSILSPGFADIVGASHDNDSGVTRVRVRVQKLGVSPVKYWNGQTWTTTVSHPDAILSDDGSWVLPNVDLSSIGGYRVRLTANDANGNIAMMVDNPLSTFTVKSDDNVKPTVGVLSPSHGDTITPGFTDISGTSSDIGEGVSRVRVRIHRLAESPTEFWNGDSWSTTSRYLDAVLHSDGSWVIPDVDVRTPGRYRIRLIGHDANGNIALPLDNPITDFTVM